MTKSRTYIATPPGFTIKEQLVDRGLSQKEFALRIGFSEKHVTQLLKGDVRLTAETANRLEMVLGVPALFWSNLESVYQEKLQKALNENQMDEDILVAKMFPYSEMAKRGWVSATRSWPEKVVQLRQFFEVARLTYLNKDELVPRIACRRHKETERADYALLAWVQQVKREARSVSVSRINLERLAESLSKVRALTLLPPGEYEQQLTDLLANCGIALVCVPSIKGSYLNGASFFDGSKIIIGMTDRGKTADVFWFSLFHELGHILCGHVGKIEGTTAGDENEADAFASSALVERQAYDEFVELCDFSKKGICAFATDQGIDPGIVVGRLQKEGYIKYSQLNDLKKSLVSAA